MTIPVTPTKAQLESATDLTPYVRQGSLYLVPSANQAMRDFAAALGVVGDIADTFVSSWARVTEDLVAAPRNELRYRLNARLRGEDPGQPENWPGERGMR